MNLIEKLAVNPKVFMFLRRIIEGNFTAEKAGIDWKRNALRHSYASYRFAQTTDAGLVAGELGNSVNMVHKHYRELVTRQSADQWFNIKPDKAASNIISVSNAG